ncbi:hypothetical protein GC722_04460 [Auraticoccus sp. F435]|uniref:Uncharacterized protein n=1 Tax=Auraticoccus cholistanensis TaxID=2656650 RepID=A0A6A9UUN2_9ACTN|nr:hypothetical protein [Auraticoccus cholistanensis]MVA75284.1 hypothetical protein [Auraticoccus cholistanensis]
MDPTPDAFRALARSSPWRFRTLHLTHRDAGHAVEAWLRRPGDLLVRDGDRLVRTQGPPQSVSGFRLDTGTGRVVPLDDPSPLWPQDVDPPLRPDGLVAERPDGPDYGDPMHQNYRWVASLDPVELSHHVQVRGLEAGLRAGRPTWTAEVVPEEGYDPRCGCCPLLFSAVSECDETAGSGYPPWHVRNPVGRYPDAYRVGLDVATGVVVSLHPVGGAGLPRLDLEIDIHAVDADLNALFG